MTEETETPKKEEFVAKPTPEAKPEKVEQKAGSNVENL